MKRERRYYDRKNNGKIIAVQTEVNEHYGEVHVTIWRDYTGPSPSWCDDSDNLAVYTAYANGGNTARLLRRGQALQQALLARVKEG